MGPRASERAPLLLLHPPHDATATENVSVPSLPLNPRAPWRALEDKNATALGCLLITGRWDPGRTNASPPLPPHDATTTENVRVPFQNPFFTRKPILGGYANQKNWAPFKVLRERYGGTRFSEQRQLHLPQKHKATVADSTLRVEMNGLEEQTDNDKARDLFWKPLSWLGTIRPTSANNAFDPALWETFTSTTLGLEVPTLASLPRLHSSPLAKCGCKKFCMDFHGDHTSTCTSHSGATKAHDWMVSVLGPLFRTAGHLVRTQHGVTASAGQRRGDVEVRNFLRDQAGSRNLVFDLSITHDRFGSSSHVQQNGSLSHPQDLDGPMRVAAQRKTNAYRQTYADNQNISFLPAIMSTSNRMHGEFLRLFFLQAHRETEEHFTPAGMPSQHNQSESFRFKRAAFYQGLKSKVGLAAAKAAALRINLNVQGCSIVAAPMHAPSRTSLLLPLLLSHNLPLPRVH
jgi:hypothetical protein